MLEQLLLSLNWTDILIFVLSTVGGGILFLMRKAFVRMYRRYKARRQWWANVCDGLGRLPQLEEDLKGIRYYVAPNGGGSLMDSAERTERAVTTLSGRLDLVVETMLAQNDTDDDVGRFHCSITGETTYVNRPYARWIGVGKQELLGWNWLNYIHPEDASFVREHWDRCRDEQRIFRLRHRLVTADGDVLHVDTVAVPIPEGAPAQRWVGTVRRIDSTACPILRNKIDVECPDG